MDIYIKNFNEISSELSKAISDCGFTRSVKHNLWNFLEECFFPLDTSNYYIMQPLWGVGEESLMED